MGKKDKADRNFFEKKERFAELMNHIYNRKTDKICPEDLVVIRRNYAPLAFPFGGKERDLLMFDKKRNIYYGLEIETESDYSMPERIMVYDASEYEEQIKEIHNKNLESKSYKTYREKKSRMTQKDFLIPIITSVLYLGTNHWKGRRTLSQMFSNKKQAEQLLGNRYPEYDFPLLEADYQNPEIYRTDLKEFFQAMQCRLDKNRLRALFNTEAFQNLSPDTEWAIAIHLNISRLVKKMEKEEVGMCKAFQDLMEEERREGKKEGRREGKKEGRKEEKIQTIRRMVQEGLDEGIINRVTKCTKEEFQAALN